MDFLAGVGKSLGRTARMLELAAVLSAMSCMLRMP